MIFCMLNNNYKIHTKIKKIKLEFLFLENKLQVLRQKSIFLEDFAKIRLSYCAYVFNNFIDQNM